MGADSGVVSRSATWADLTPVTETISLAFHDDPTWSWAFPDRIVARRNTRCSGG